MIQMVLSGGQTGADLAGWRAAKAIGIATSGWMPKGFLSEDGPHPGFADEYGAKEFESESYPARTRANLAFVAEEQATAVVFDATEAMSPGTKCLLRAHFELVCKRQPYPGLVVVRLRYVDGELRVSNRAYQPAWLVKAIRNDQATHLLVAGDRESISPGIGAYVERYLTEAFRLLKEGPP